jgi:hypothetical protein
MCKWCNSILRKCECDGVILTAGVDEGGVLPLVYFSKAVDVNARTGKVVFNPQERVEFISKHSHCRPKLMPETHTHLTTNFEITQLDNKMSDFHRIYEREKSNVILPFKIKYFRWTQYNIWSQPGKKVDVARQELVDGNACVFQHQWYQRWERQRWMR